MPGINNWDPNIWYNGTVTVVGSDGNLYTSIASSRGVDPTKNPTAWKLTSSLVAASLDPTQSGVIGVPVVRRFPFNFATPNLNEGVTVYTPTVGDLLLEAWVETTVGWNGTAMFDFGNLTNGYGLFYLMHNAYPLGSADNVTGAFRGLNTGGFSDAKAASNFIQMGGNYGVGIYTVSGSTVLVDNTIFSLGTKYIPGTFVNNDPVKIVVSQSGQVGGAPCGSTIGAGNLYLVTVTPI